MENTEEVFQALEEFSKKKHKVISRELDEYLHFVARTGDPVYQWGLVKQLFKEKLLNVITDFYETSPGIDIPHCRNVEIFNYETMKNSLLEKIDAFAAAPFTIQRICELLTSPRKQYSRIDKFMRAFEKNILVVSTREPGPLRHSDSELDNGDAQESLVNGSDSNSDYNVDVDMEDMSNWKETADPLTYAVHSSEDTEASRDDYSAHNGPVHREMMSVEGLEANREDDEEKGPQPSTSSGDDEKMDEDEDEMLSGRGAGGSRGDSSGDEDSGERSSGQEECEEIHKLTSGGDGETEEDVEVDRVVEDVSPVEDKPEEDEEEERELEEPTVEPIVTQVDDNKPEPKEDKTAVDEETDAREKEGQSDVPQEAPVETITEEVDEQRQVEEQKEELQLNIIEETTRDAEETEKGEEREIEKTQQENVEMDDKEETATNTPAEEITSETHSEKGPEATVEVEEEKNVAVEEYIVEKEASVEESKKEVVMSEPTAAEEESSADTVTVPEPDIISSSDGSSVGEEKVEEVDAGEVAPPKEASTISSEATDESS